MTKEGGLSLDVASSQRMTAVELVRNTLRAAILRGDLPGGTQLVQTEIATQLDVSTTPVREAMRDLAAEGLIALDSHRVGTVHTHQREEMVEIVEIRHSLERLTVHSAMANISESELSQARVLAEELREEEDLGTWVQKNIEFHSIFHMATRTVRLQGILVSLQEAAGVFVAQAQRLHPEIRRQAIDDHFALLEAYENQDAERAIAIEHSHVSLPLQALEPESDPV